MTNLEWIAAFYVGLQFFRVLREIIDDARHTKWRQRRDDQAKSFQERMFEELKARFPPASTVDQEIRDLDRELALAIHDAERKLMPK